MTGPENKRANKRQYWQDQIKTWQASGLAQSVYCAQSGINLSTFVYWRNVFLKQEDRKTKRFARVTLIKQENIMAGNQSIQIKLLTGHIVHLPIEMETNEIAKLIHLIGSPHA